MSFHAALARAQPLGYLANRQLLIIVQDNAVALLLGQTVERVNKQLLKLPVRGVVLGELKAFVLELGAGLVGDVHRGEAFGLALCHAVCVHALVVRDGIQPAAEAVGRPQLPDIFVHRDKRVLQHVVLLRLVVQVPADIRAQPALAGGVYPVECAAVARNGFGDDLFCQLLTHKNAPF